MESAAYFRKRFLMLMSLCAQRDTDMNDDQRLFILLCACYLKYQEQQENSNESIRQ